VTHSAENDAAYLGNRTKPNPNQPGRCPSIDPHDTLQCGRRVHDDDQCQLGGIAWKKGAKSAPPTLLYHWSPVANRASIEREGLRPGSPSNTFPEWSAPHVCYGETPPAALGLTLLDVALDLWMIRTEGHAFTRANDDQEWRSVDAVRAWYVGTRGARDPVIDMTPAEQAEADEIVQALWEDYRDRVTSPEDCLCLGPNVCSTCDDRP